MREYIAFTKKEFIENIRTYKFMFMITIFILLGFMNPVLAKFLSKMLKAENIDISTLDKCTPLGQFFNNVGGYGLFILVIVFCGIIANEFSHNTLINILTKGMKRSTVIFSKFTVATTIWTISYVLCFAVTYFYTIYYWNMNGLNNIFLTFLNMWLFGILLISLIILGGVIFKNIYGSMFLTGGVVVLISIISNVPKLQGFQKYNPIILSHENWQLLNGQKIVSDFIPAIIICAIVVFINIFCSITIFNKKQI